MSRPLRIFYRNAYYHVTCRGNGRGSIFLADSDRKRFLELLGRSCEIYQVDLLAFVLMTNHFHLIVKTPRANLNEFMRHFNISYTAYFNKQHKRSGHLYQGRYKAFLIDADSYLTEVSRYLHLNPVHTQELAAIDNERKKEYLRKYRWSSYPDYLSSKPRYPSMLFHEILGYFNGSRSAYRQFVEEALSSPEKPLEKGKGHGIIGNPDFIKGLLKEIPVRPGREQPSARKVISRVEAERVLQAVAKRFRVTSEDIMKKNYKGPARSIAMELLYRHAGINQREIGELMGVDYSTISVARKRLQNSLDQDQKLKKHVTSLERMLNQE